MRVRVIGALIIAMVLCGIGMSRTTSASGDNQEYADIPPSAYLDQHSFVPESGCVPDDSTAVRIAEAVWLPVYGKNIFMNRPFRAQLIGDTIWIVCGSLKRNFDGGVPYAKITKRDGQIVGIGHGK